MCAQLPLKRSLTLLNICVMQPPSLLSAMQVLAEPNWPDDWPFSPRDFQRFDESVDTAFYDSPRFVTHIDDGAIGALTKCACMGFMHACKVPL